jgi:ureidoacrylate peracid hydrolase
MNEQPQWEPFALLLIDVQRDFWTENTAASFPKFPSRTANLLSVCRTEGIEVIHLRASFRADMSDWMVRYKLRGRIPCVEGTPGIETLPFACEQPGELVLTKHTFDGFQNPALVEYLRQRGKRFILTAGLVTSTCVLFTTVSAAQSGFLTAIIEDCCADDPNAHEQTLESYPFIFDPIPSVQIVDQYPKWKAALDKLDALSTP